MSNDILIVDDDDRIRNLLKDYLSENNYIVSSAENAEDAKLKISYLNFDIIVLDVMMPGQDGYELTKEIKKKSKSNFTKTLSFDRNNQKLSPKKWVRNAKNDNIKA